MRRCGRDAGSSRLYVIRNAGQCTFQQRLAVQMISSQVFSKKAVEATAALILYAAGSSHLPRREESQSNALDFSSALACQDPF